MTGWAVFSQYPGKQGDNTLSRTQVCENRSQDPTPTLWGAIRGSPSFNYPQKMAGISYTRAYRQD